MDGKSYSTLISGLCDKHYKRDIDFAAYREQRKKLLREIDAHYNGVFVQPDDQCDTRVRNDLSLESAPDTDFLQTCCDAISDEDTSLGITV